MDDLASRAMGKVKSGDIKFFPKIGKILILTGLIIFKIGAYQDN